MNNKKHDSDLIEVQRGVITQGTDGGQFNQGVILSAPHWFIILVPVDKHKVFTSVVTVHITTRIFLND